MAAEIINLDPLPDGVRYEDTYGSWLKIFQTMAERADPILIYGCPRSWASLAYYLGNTVMTVRDHFPTDPIARATPELLVEMEKAGLLRQMVESHSTLRPELVDALYKVDVEWKVNLRQQEVNGEIKADPMTLVTNNASFFRPQFMRYLTALRAYRTPAKRCVVVTCAADKPYPAPLHSAVRRVIPDSYEMVIATGVLGIVPEEGWGTMPLYDSGMPNQWRCMVVAEEYFRNNPYDHIIVYSDFYASAIARALQLINFDKAKVDFIFGDHDGLQYQDLMSNQNLVLLRQAVRP